MSGPPEPRTLIMVRAAILGSTGYTALELIKILLNHSQVEITALTTRQDEAPHVSEVHPALHGRLDLRCEPLALEEISERADAVFGCLPHGASMAAIPGLLDAGLDPANASPWDFTDPASARPGLDLYPRSVRLRCRHGWVRH